MPAMMQRRLCLRGALGAGLASCIQAPALSALPALGLTTLGLTPQRVARADTDGVAGDAAGGGAGSAHAADDGAGAGHTVTPWPAGLQAPPLRALDMQGRSWSLEGLRGRAVLINFWASWCAPCRIEMPTLQTLAGFYGDAVRVLAVNVGEGPRAIARFLQSSALDTGLLTVLLDPEKEIARAWGAARVLPTTVLIDARGRPRHRVQGELDWGSEQAQALVDALIA
jgi:thiol-disulfide isomerase/thioredoxin